MFGHIRYLSSFSANKFILTLRNFKLKLFCEDAYVESHQTNLILILTPTSSRKVQYNPRPQREYAFYQERPPNRNLL